MQQLSGHIRNYLRVSVTLVFFVLMVFHRAEGACQSANEIECKSGGLCIRRDYICNQQKNCPDGSDEDTKFCQLWPERQGRCRHNSGGTIFEHQYGCYTAYHMCSDNARATLVDSKICKIVLAKKLEETESMNMSGVVISLLSSAVNSTLNYKTPDCPMLYTRVGDQCLSLFSPAKIPWAEARQFCISIYGDLWQTNINDLATYGRLVEYMREEKLTSNYWIGGRYDMDTNAWSWARDDSPMPLGPPFWTIKHESSCQRRGPPHTDPYSNPPAALPDATCYNTVLSPNQRSSGWCSAMTYEYYYYWSDEKCDEAFSPLCVFTGPAAHTPPDNAL